jgi:hypothetical protein
MWSRARRAAKENGETTYRGVGILILIIDDEHARYRYITKYR